MQQKLGDFYATCTDDKAVEALGAKPLAEDLARIAAVADKKGLPAEIGTLQRLGINVFFAFGAEQDFKESSSVIAIADQGGLGLPDRDYYFKTEENFVKQREQYVEHVRKMFVLAGDPAPQAAANAKAVMTIETALAKNAFDLVTRRDPNKIYHRMTRAELLALTKTFTWEPFLTATGAPQFPTINVTEPEFFKGVDAVIASNSLDDLKTYMRWHVIHVAAPFLSSAFVNENFDFYGRVLTGRKALLPRWKRCVQYTDADLGEALGQLYVDATFGADGKRRMLELVGESRALAAQGHQRSRLDDDQDEAAGARQARHVRQEDRLSRQVARLLRAHHRPRRSPRQFQARERIRAPPPAREDRQAARSHRVADVAADGECVLQPADERDRVPRGHSAAAVLRSIAGRRGELRIDRRGDRPRDDARLRRSGPPVRQGRQPRRLVDRVGRACSSRSGPTA